MMKRNTDIVTLKGKQFILPERRRKILSTWISDEIISEENREFEKQYNKLPDVDDYIPEEILKNGIASIVVRTATNKVIKNAELSYEDKAQMTSLFSQAKRNDKFLRYEIVGDSLLICNFLEDFKSMADLSDNEVLAFIDEITHAVKKMGDQSHKDDISREQAHVSKFGPAGYNVHFPKFLDYAVKENKINTTIANELIIYHKELNDLPKQIIHGDLSRANAMYKKDEFIIIDPKINIGRPFEDLAKFVLKSQTKESGNDTMKIISRIEKLLPQSEFSEFKKWLYIYTVSIYAEYINIEKNEKSKFIVDKIDRMFDYIVENVQAVN